MRCEHLKDKMKKSQEKALYSIPGWEEFVSNGFDNYKIEYRSFEDAREYVRNENLNNGKEWHKWCKSGKKPDNIPSAPNTTYKDFWVSWGDWLGTGNIASQNKKFRSFEDARGYMRNENLDSAKDWRSWRSSGKKPDDIPANPNTTYKDFWVSWGDWLGTGNTHKKEYRSFEDAREYVRNEKLDSQRDWQKWSKSGKRPDDIPSSPARTYKDSGWICWADWLGNGNIANQNRKYRSFEEARKYARNEKLNSREAWYKSGERPNDIPCNPHRTYKDSGWVNWGDWLGTGNISSHNRNFRSFEDAREYIRNENLDSAKDWQKWSKSSNRPDDIPANPYHFYRDSWTSWADWLGINEEVTEKSII